jgi:hypothetical protein
MNTSILFVLDLYIVAHSQRAPTKYEYTLPGFELAGMGHFAFKFISEGSEHGGLFHN